MTDESPVVPGSSCVPCPTCGRTTQVRVWKDRRGWVALPAPVEAVTGTAHQCVVSEGIS